MELIVTSRICEDGTANMTQLFTFKIFSVHSTDRVPHAQTFLFPPAYTSRSIHIRKPGIQNDQVNASLLNTGHASGARRYPFGSTAFDLECKDDVIRNGYLVFYQQYSFYHRFYCSPKAKGTILSGHQEKV